MATIEHMTGTRNVSYNLISVLYHTLQGAETYARYLADAEQAGDQELIQFLRQVQEEDRRRADQAKMLLRQRLSQEGDVTEARV